VPEGHAVKSSLLSRSSLLARRSLGERTRQELRGEPFAGRGRPRRTRRRRRGTAAACNRPGRLRWRLPSRSRFARQRLERSLDELRQSFVRGIPSALSGTLGRLPRSLRWSRALRIRSHPPLAPAPRSPVPMGRVATRDNPSGRWTPPSCRGLGQSSPLPPHGPRPTLRRATSRISEIQCDVTK
jgi:hypothetical protein